MEVFFLVVPLFIVLAIAIRLVAGGFDHNRVSQYVESQGGKVISANWSPFGPGWFGDKHNRIYEVRYVDRDGNEHHAYCKTSMLTGVYFTEDRIVAHARGGKPQPSSLEEENRRLRAELDRLRGKER